MGAQWFLTQELGIDYYKLFESNGSEGEDPDQAMRTIEWEEEEKKPK